MNLSVQPACSQRARSAVKCPSPYSAVASVFAVAKEEAERLREAIDALPLEYKEVVLKAYVVGMSRRAIGDEMGRSEGAVRMLLGRAIAKLGELLDGERER